MAQMSRCLETAYTVELSGRFGTVAFPGVIGSLVVLHVIRHSDLIVVVEGSVHERLEVAQQRATSPAKTQRWVVGRFVLGLFGCVGRRLAAVEPAEGAVVD